MAAKLAKPDAGEDFEIVARDTVPAPATESLLSIQQQIDSIRQWLQPTEFMSPGNEFMKHLNAYVPNTGNWARESGAFSAWAASSGPENAQGCLHIRGVAGSGKSVFAASTIRQLKEADSAVPVLFFFFRQIVEKNHSAKYLVRDFVSQLLPYSASLVSDLGVMSKARGVAGSELGELWQALVRALDGLDRAYCIVDALDEMDDEYFDFIQQLLKLGSRKPHATKVLMTSRPLPRIEEALRHPGVLQLKFDSSLIQPDVAKYVATRLECLEPRLSKVNEELVKNAICKRAEGLFIYARFVTDTLIEGLDASHYTEATLLDDLQNLPHSLRNVYEDMLREHARRSGVSTEQQARILTCVTYSARPMRLIELGSIVALMPGNDKDDLKKAKDLVRASCGRLLEILEDDTVSIIHHSFTEFLHDASRGSCPGAFPVLTPEAAHGMLAIIFLEFMDICPLVLTDADAEGGESYESFDDPGDMMAISDRRRQQMQDMQIEHPLIDLALGNLLHHLVEARGNTDDVMTALDKYLVPGRPAWGLMMMRFWKGRFCGSFNRIHLATVLNFPFYCFEHFVALEQNRNAALIDARDGEGRTPLSYAAQEGKTHVARLLLECEADPKSDCRNGMTPLHYAVKAGHSEVMKLLLDAGVNPLIEKTKPSIYSMYHFYTSDKGDTALKYGLRGDDPNVVAALIPYIPPDDFDKSLSRVRKPINVEAILRTGKANVDSFLNGVTKFYMAAQRHELEIMKILLQHGADPNKRCALDDFRDSFGEVKTASELDETSTLQGPTPLHGFAGRDHKLYIGDSDEEKTRNAKECFSLLLKHGANVNETTRGNNAANMTPLHFAVRKDRDSSIFSFMSDSNKFNQVVSKLLLDAGAEVNAMNGDGNTPLHLANPENTKLINLLIKRGADLNAKNNAGRTPLLEMMCGLYWAKPKVLTMEVLGGHGKNCDAADNRGNNLFHYVMRNLTKFTKKHIPFFRLALQGSEDAINKRDEKGESPILKYTAESVSSYDLTPRDQKELLEDFIRAGLDLNMRDNDGKTVLWRLIDNHTAKIKAFTMLVGLGADPKIRANDGTTLFQAAQKRGLKTEWPRLLASYGVDCASYDENGNNLIHSLFASMRTDRITKESLNSFHALLEMGVPHMAKNKNGKTVIDILASLKYGGISDRSGWLRYVLQADEFRGLDVDGPDAKGIAPIHSAAGRSECNVEILLEAGADPTAITVDGLSPLHIAAMERQPNVVGRLLTWYQDHEVLKEQINLPTNNNGRTPLHYACRSGRPESVWNLLRHGADAGIEDQSGMTPLHVLAEFQKANDGLYGDNDERTVDIVRLLLDAGVDLETKVNRQDGIKMTPMDLALQNGCLEMARELRRRGATAPPEKLALLDDFPRTFTPDEHGGTIRSALNKGEYEAIKHYLLEDSDRLYAISDIVEWGHLDLLEHFAGAIKKDELVVLSPSNDAFDETPDDVSNNDSDHDSYDAPVYHTTFSRVCDRQLPSLHIIQALVEKAGLDATTINKAYVSPTILAKATPLHNLARGHHYWQAEALEYLLALGADAEAKAPDGATLLVTALRSSGFWKEETVRVLLKYKADPQAVKSKTGQSCLALSDSAGITRALLEHGAKLGDQTSILQSAVKKMDAEMAEALIEAGADPNYIDKEAAITQWQTPEGESRPEPVEEFEDTRQRIRDFNQRQERETNMVRYFLHSAARPVTVDHQPMFWDEHRDALVRVLLDGGADPWATYANGDTVVHRVIHDKGLVAPLLDGLNCDLNCRGQNGQTLLISACRPAIAPEPPIYSSRNPPYPLANTDAIRLLLARHVDVFSTDDGNRTALHWMLTSGRRFDNAEQEAFTALVERGGQKLVMTADDNGVLPLHLALASGQFGAVWCLLAHSANVSSPNPLTGDTALHLVVRRLVGETGAAAEAAELWTHLVNLGLDINAQNHVGYTPALAFSRAGWRGTRDPDYVLPHPYYAMHHDTTHCTTLALLVDAGANLMAVNHEGQGMLHLLAGRRIGNPNGAGRDQVKDIEDFFERLLELGLDPRLEDKALRTPIDLAVARNQRGILEIFTPKGRNRSEEKVMKLAKYGGDEDDESEEDEDDVGIFD
ncbi:hypothetical protein PFICI_07452 [Pestalotiopsis fici W106-1]|uniref:NACHT domain-containing protein n=1 Tax=Pestalotiopsis fici (strain W106-1 / CGMCC3.15140) TaxID=1229662 RepID=W3X1C1_PESFW|nr:uncharacterized protein PFICI_07452 [Pestalotiopsis fici W106-1]ETS79923.1 hypothetical protein PFICI_07452 [Pestalotiopsis fici W106-1]